MYMEKLALYDKLVAANPNFKRKGKTMPYTSANGYMFSFLNKEGEIGIRLPKEAGKKFMEEHNSTIFKSHGAVMKDYVLVPDEMLENLELVGEYLQIGFDYVMSLEQK